MGRLPGVTTIKDISKDGRVLMANETYRLEIQGRRPGDDKETELSWLDFSLVTDISPDGSAILITESGEGGGPGYSAYLRKTDGSPAVRLGEGSSQGFSPDGQWALAPRYRASAGGSITAQNVTQRRRIHEASLNLSRHGNNFRNPVT